MYSIHFIVIPLKCGSALSLRVWLSDPLLAPIQDNVEGSCPQSIVLTNRTSDPPQCSTLDRQYLKHWHQCLDDTFIDFRITPPPKKDSDILDIWSDMFYLWFILQQLLFCCLSVSSTWSGFWMCTHTILSHCVYWFFWLPTNNFWCIASLSRLMHCGWLMSATINGLMLPTFSKPRINPSIWVTVGSTGRQKHVCTGTHFSSYCLSLLHFLLYGSLIQSLISALFLFNPSSLCVCLSIAWLMQ